MTDTCAAGSEENWAGWKEYMGTKISKLDQQFDGGKTGSNSSIFEGISIFVLGYTVPVASELKRLMQAYGGRHHQYKLSTTTHTIASTLAAGKLRTMRAKGELIVRPDWITECVKAGRLLSEEPFLISGKARITDRKGHQEIETPALNEVTDQNDNKSASGSPCISNSPVDDENQKNHPVSTGEQPSNFSTKAVPRTTDDNFVTEFYSNSRLHFISTLAQEMKDYVRRVRTSGTELKFVGKDDLIARFGAKSRKTPSKDFLRDELDSFDDDKEEKEGQKEDFMPQGPFYMHVDMDCFFVSVGLLKRSHLAGKPVAICHSKGVGPRSGQTAQDETGFQSHAEVASCSYEARAAGVKNGMFLGSARKLCPELVAIPYDFEDYRAISRKLYDTVLEYTEILEPVSCDEMYVEIGELCREVGVEPKSLATELRRRIFEETKCKASIGMGPTFLAARLATKVAKPDGQHLILPQNLKGYVSSLNLKDMPGFGYATLDKLRPLGVETCQNFLDHSKEELARLLGPKSYEKLANACLGEDGRKIDACPQIRKSISCTINYGIRLKSEDEAIKFLADLSLEVSRRMKAANVAGRQITLQLLIRAANAPIEAVKFLGCGHCDAVSKSKEIGFQTDDPEILKREAVKLLRELKPVISDMRGVGIFVQKLAADKFSIVNNAKRATPMTSFFGRKPSPKKSKIQSPKKSERVNFKDFADCLRPFGTGAKFADDFVPLPEFCAKSSGDLDFFEQQFQIMAATSEELSEIDIQIIEEQVAFLANSWNIEHAQRLVQLFNSYRKIAVNEKWGEVARRLDNFLQDVLQKSGMS